MALSSGEAEAENTARARATTENNLADIFSTFNSSIALARIRKWDAGSVKSLI